MPKLSIMDHSGHSTVEFDRANKVSVDDAMKRFEELTKERGFTAAAVRGQGKNEVIRSFEQGADAEEILLIPRYQGG